MKSFVRRPFIHLLLVAVLCVLITGAMTKLVKAQGGDSVTVTITGTLNSIAPDGAIVVDGVTYHLGAGVPLPPSEWIGTKITIVGTIDGNTQVVIVISIKIVNGPTATASATLAASPTPTTTPSTLTPAANPAVIVVVEGPVRAIKANVIVIFDINVQVAPEDPMLRVIKIGDFARARGAFNPAGILVAVEISNLPGQTTNGATVLLDGRVETVQNNVIRINGIDVEFSPGDPKLKTMTVGVFVSITGNFKKHGTTVVLVVVTVVIINDADVVIYLDCKHHKGMGMGMGMGDDGMGMGMGMGAYDCH